MHRNIKMIVGVVGLGALVGLSVLVYDLVVSDASTQPAVVVQESNDLGNTSRMVPSNDTHKGLNDVKFGFLNSVCKPDNLPYLVAEQQGYFDEVNAQVVAKDRNEISWGDATGYAKNYDVIVAGRAELYHMEAVTPQTWKIFIGNVNTKDKTDYAILIRKDSIAKSLADLKGKTIGLEASSGKARFVLMDLVLENLGFNLKDFRIIDAKMADLENKEVDALYIREPQLTLALSTGRYKILLDAPIVKYVMDPWPQGFYAMSSDFARNRGEVKNKVEQSLNRAVDFIRAYPKEAGAILGKCASTQYNVANLNFRPFEYWKSTEFDMVAIQKQVNLYYAKKLISRQFEVGEIILK